MIGEKIKTLRKSQHLTQVELAEKLGTTQPVLQKWETGIKNPSLRTLKKLSKIFDVSLDALAFDDKDIEMNHPKNKPFLNQLQNFERLNPNEQQAVVTMINSMSYKKVI